jgi:hypothetical protein
VACAFAPPPRTQFSKPENYFEVRQALIADGNCQCGLNKGYRPGRKAATRQNTKRSRKGGGTITRGYATEAAKTVVAVDLSVQCPPTLTPRIA